MTPLGIYIHVPFCETKCPYCDFYSIRGRGLDRERYIKAVKRELSKNWGAQNYCADTVYFGGGTPSVLSGDEAADIISEVRDKFTLSSNPEITFECNPSSQLEANMAAYAAAGVNRISLGMQSAVDSERRLLGRLAGRARIEEAIALTRKCGIDNISLDVMLGIPNQTMESLDETIDFCLESGVPHISAYMLIIEEGTVFARRREKLNLPDDDTVSDMYLHLIERFEDAGLMQYEISNFAKPGFESRHNLKYWHCDEYLGIGPAAHSYLGGRRFFYDRDLESFEDGSCAVTDEGAGGGFEERLMLALRLIEGYKGALPDSLLRKAKEPRFADYLAVSEDGIRLTKKGFLVSNTIISELI